MTADQMLKAIAPTISDDDGTPNRAYLARIATALYDAGEVAAADGKEDEYTELYRLADLAHHLSQE